MLESLIYHSSNGEEIQYEQEITLGSPVLLIWFSAECKAILFSMGFNSRSQRVSGLPKI